MVTYELQVNSFQAQETADMLAGDWIVLNKGATKVLVENHEFNEFTKSITEKLENE